MKFLFLELAPTAKIFSRSIKIMTHDPCHATYVNYVSLKFDLKYLIFSKKNHEFSVMETGIKRKREAYLRNRIRLKSSENVSKYDPV